MCDDYFFLGSFSLLFWDCFFDVGWRVKQWGRPDARRALAKMPHWSGNPERPDLWEPKSFEREKGRKRESGPNVRHREAGANKWVSFVPCQPLFGPFTRKTECPVYWPWCTFAKFSPSFSLSLSLSPGLFLSRSLGIDEERENEGEKLTTPENVMQQAKNIRKRRFVDKSMTFASSPRGCTNKVRIRKTFWAENADAVTRHVK